MKSIVKTAAAVAGLAGVAVGLDRISRDAHENTIKSTVKRLHRARDDGDLLAAHVDDRRLDGHTASFAQSHDLDHIPDIVLRGFNDPNLVIEVEDADSLQNDPGDAREQLREFRITGYKRVLLVPSDATDAAAELADEVDGSVAVETPDSIDRLV